MKQEKRLPCNYNILKLLNAGEIVSAKFSRTNDEKEKKDSRTFLDKKLLYLKIAKRPTESRAKRQKVEPCHGIINQLNSSSRGELPSDILGPLPGKARCAHPASCGGLCTNCGRPVDHGSAIPLRYVHESYMIADHEMVRVRGEDLKKMIHKRRKLYLVLDLDHTLLNSTRLIHINEDEAYLNTQRDALPDTLKESLFKLDHLQMVTKLRPYVHNFLKEANDMFEMYIYTMGDRCYALEMAKLLDPGNKYFESRIISRGDSTTKSRKGLDIVLGDESTIIILDDTEEVWKENKNNLILMERYHYFASSCKSFGIQHNSLSQLRRDESETEGALATVLKILRRIHCLFFEKGKEGDRDVREVVKSVRKEILKDCRIVFTRVIPYNSRAEHHHLWRMAEQMGATCSMEVDPSVTHVVSLDATTYKSRWAVMHDKFLVTPVWLEACNYLWTRQPEEKFRVECAS